MNLISLLQKLKKVKDAVIEFFNELMGKTPAPTVVDLNEVGLKEVITRSHQKARKALNKIAVKVVAYINLVDPIRPQLNALNFHLFDDLILAYTYINKGDAHYALKRIVDLISSGELDRIILMNKAIVADSKENPDVSVDLVVLMETILNRQISIAETFKSDKDKLGNTLESSEAALKEFLSNTVK